MQYDGLIWEPLLRVGFVADPVSIAEILWSIQSTWYLVSICDPSDKDTFDQAMEYFIDRGLFDEPIIPNVDIIAKRFSYWQFGSNLFLVKPNDLQSLTFMIAYSDFDGLQIRSLDTGYIARKPIVKSGFDLWRNVEDTMIDNRGFFDHFPAMKDLSTINILWGLPNWEFLSNALVVSKNEKALYRMKDAIEQYHQNHLQQSDEYGGHQVILCNAREEILKLRQSEIIKNPTN